jgi:hypothetical protein
MSVPTLEEAKTLLSQWRRYVVSYGDEGTHVYWFKPDEDLETWLAGSGNPNLPGPYPMAEGDFDLPGSRYDAIIMVNGEREFMAGYETFFLGPVARQLQACGELIDTFDDWYLQPEDVADRKAYRDECDAYDGECRAYEAQYTAMIYGDFEGF